MLDQSLAKLMQRVLEQEATTTRDSTNSRRLLELGFGRLVGKTLHFTERDRSGMRELLQARGFATTRLPLKEMSRSDRLAAGTPNEKAGGGVVKRGRVSVKTLPGRGLHLRGHEIRLPEGCHVDTDWRLFDEDLSLHDGILLVENYEAFNDIHLTALSLSAGIENPIVVYRGDKEESRQDNVKTFLGAMDLPVLAFVDMDPQGLLIALSYPRLVGVLAPNKADLEQVLSSPSFARQDLYRKQLPGTESRLSAVEDSSPIHSLWELIRKHRAGAVQELWIAAKTPCVTWT